MRAKLVQTWQALGKKDERDAERAELVKLHQTTQDEEFKKTSFFCMDQFETSGKKLMVFEYFKLTGDRAMRYKFYILKPDGGTDYYISLGSYEMTTAIARETGGIGKDQRLFHLDGYYDEGRRHRTFGMFKKEPSYEETKQMVVDILAGKMNAMSGTDAR